MRPNALDQYFLELVNRARLDPVKESQRLSVPLNQGLNPGSILPRPMQPLAWDTKLQTAAQGHSAWMLNSNKLDHTGSGGSSPQDRITDAGYAEAGTYFSGENIGWTSQFRPNTTKMTRAVYENLFGSPSHRINMLADFFREVGTSVVSGPFQGLDSVVVTQDFGLSGPEQYLTGVAYQDADNDQFYTPGEGQSGITISIDRADGTSDTTAAAGGFVTQFIDAGSARVTFSGGPLSSPIAVNITTGLSNIKLDLVNNNHIHSSTSLSLLAGINAATLLGAAHLQLNGNNRNNSLNGNRGHNHLNGLGGDDTLRGGDGNDTYSVDNPLDRISETALQGTDVVLSRISYTLSANVEKLTLLGTGNFRGTGSNGNNNLLGNAGTNFLNGRAGHDHLIGAAGNDRLLGANLPTAGRTERDTLTGGTGSDTFVLANAANAFYTGTKAADFAYITGFQSKIDRLELHGPASDYFTKAASSSGRQGTGLYVDSNHNGTLQTSQDELIAIFNGPAKSTAQLLQNATLL